MTESEANHLNFFLLLKKIYDSTHGMTEHEARFVKTNCLKLLQKTVYLAYTIKLLQSCNYDDEKYELIEVMSCVSLAE